MLIPVDATSRERFRKLFQTLDQEAVVWCSWKSNQHFEDGIDAQTDLDLLFLPADRRRVTRIMRSCGFRLFTPARHRAYPGVVDYISFETSTGKVLHIHAHFLLTLGEKNAKSFIFPWNERILGRREPAKALESAYFSNPADELVLLLVREAVKIRARDALGNREAASAFGSKGFSNEYKWLKEKVDLENFRNAAASMFETEILTLLLSAYTKPDAETMDKLKRATNGYGYAQGWKRLSPSQTVLTMLKNEACNNFCRIFEKLKWPQYHIPRRRLLPYQGIVVAVLGADGSGKSTVTRAIQADWQHKIDIPLFYMGLGDGQHNLWVSAAKLILSCGRVIRGIRKGKPSQKAAEPLEDKTIQTYTPHPLLPLAGALAKKSIIRKIKKLRNAGYIVISDRWPQAGYPGMNDGPMLAKSLNHKNPLVKFLSQWEKRQYETLDRMLKPDLCIKLIASLNTALERKPENGPFEKTISEKIEIIKKLQISSGQNDVIVNADRDLTAVLQEVREIIFKQILNQNAPRPGQYYECLGLPGSGKTSVTKALTEQGTHILFSSHYEKTFSNLSMRAKALTASCCFDFLLYIKIFAFTYRYKLWKSKNIPHLLKAPMRRRALLNLPEGGRYIADQRFLQDIWSILIDLKDQKEVLPHHLAPLIKALYHEVDPQIIYFKSGPQTAAQRVEARTGGISRFDGRPASEISEELERAQAPLNSIVKSCYFAGLNVIEVDTSSHTVQDIAKLIEEFDA